MTALFVSYSSSDRVVANDVRARLERDGYVAIFLDDHPSQGIAAGRRWELELYAQLHRTDAVIFLASAASVSSRWCFAEIVLARSMGRPVFAVRIERDVTLPVLADVQWVDATPGRQDDAIHRLHEGLRRAGLDPADAYAWDPTRSPYPGLRPFSRADAAVFFAREREIDRLIELLQPTLRHDRGRFVAIVGPSGSGKSSLLRAGVLPRLRANKARWIVLPTILPGQRPMAQLVHSLVDAGRAEGADLERAQVADRLDQGRDGLIELVDVLNAAARPASEVLVVIDQAEELVTRSSPHERAVFLDLLRGAITGDHRLWVLASLRSEFLSTAPERAGLAEAVDDAIVVEPLSRRQLPEVIERPAQRGGMRFAPGLVARIVEDTAGGDALPMLAHTLRALHDRVGEGGTVAAVDYAEVGGVVGALQHRADQLLDELDRYGLRDRVLPLLLRLASVEGAAEPTSRRQLRSALTGEEWVVAEAFLDARLLTSRAAGDGDATIEVAHEALLRQWLPLRRAIEASRDVLRRRTELERLAADWEAADRDDSYLVRGDRLAAFADPPVAERLDERSMQFLVASRRLAAREAAEAKRSARRRRVLVSGVVVLALVLAAIGTMVARPQIAAIRLQHQAQQILPMVDIAAATAVLGGTRDQRRVPVDAYALDRYEVTTRAYELCVQAGACTPAATEVGTEPPPRVPVVNVTARQAAAFCAWIGRRLPTAVEWERAARGTRGRPWPWGANEPTADVANVQVPERPPSGLVAVDDPAYAAGATPEGVMHLVGNAGEWTATPARCLDDPYACSTSWDGRAEVPGLLVMGGNWQAPVETTAAANPAKFGWDADSIGFRCAM